MQLKAPVGVNGKRKTYLLQRAAVIHQLEDDPVSSLSSSSVESLYGIGDDVRRKTGLPVVYNKREWDKQ